MRNTPIQQVQGMIKKMKGVRWEWGYPVLENDGVLANEDKAKAVMLEG